MRTICLAILLTAPLVGCSLPPEEPGFASRDPSARVRAAALVDGAGDPDSIRELISTLDSDDPAARMVASASLRRQTGMDFGYLATAPRSDRSAAADRWEAWYRRTHLGQDAPDPSGEVDQEASRTMEASASP